MLKENNARRTEDDTKHFSGKPLPDDGVIFTAEPAEQMGDGHQILKLSYPNGQVRRITNDLNDYHFSSFSADGRHIASVNRLTTGAVWLSEPNDADRVRQITSGRADGIQGLTWLDDERHIA